MAFDFSIWKSEVRRGIVELCLLSVLKDREAYGYEIIERIKEQSGLQLVESTVYPMLTRLSKDGLLATRQGESPNGPPRRYFRLTKSGLEKLDKMIEYWISFQHTVTHLIQTPPREGNS